VYPGASIASALLGHGPDDIYGTNGLDPNSLLPVGPFSTVANLDGSGTSFFLLGSDGQLGRDEFLRLLYGARVSLEVAIGATILGMVVGILMGAIAGYFGGWIDTIVSRITEVVMAFPVLLFIIALASTIGDRLNHVTLGFLQPGVFMLTVVIGVFGWYYPARIIRAVVLSLREKEFVEAARMLGASDARIIRSHLLPHLVAPIIVYSTLIVAQNILLEAGLSFLTIGIPLGTPSWGNLLSTAPDYYLAQPWLMIWPGLAVLVTTLGFNLLGDGLRDAFDPRSAH
jgi:peptide/nickel transport system permease protein